MTLNSHLSVPVCEPAGGRSKRQLLNSLENKQKLLCIKYDVTLMIENGLRSSVCVCWGGGSAALWKTSAWRSSCLDIMCLQESLDLLVRGQSQVKKP